MGVRILPPAPFTITTPFPIGSGSFAIGLPHQKEIQKGDFIVSRYTSSSWTKILPWEGWYHAALVSEKEPLTIIEAIGANLNNQPEGPSEILFSDSVGFEDQKIS